MGGMRALSAQLVVGDVVLRPERTSISIMGAGADKSSTAVSKAVAASLGHASPGFSAAIRVR